MTKKNGERAIVLCTAKRAVVFGYTAKSLEEIMASPVVTLERARMCSYWSEETRGVLGLASIGPQKGSRIGPAVSDLALESPTAAMACSEEAVKAWEAAPWN